MTVRFLTPASKELVQAIQFYEDQRVGLGREFLIEVDQTIELITSFPLSWPLYMGNVISSKRKRNCGRSAYGYAAGP